MEIRKIFIGDRKMSLQTWASRNKVPNDYARELIRCIENPKDLPFMIQELMEGFTGLKPKGKMAIRNGLVRIQMAASIYNHSDPIMMEKQNYVTIALEKFLYGDNILVRDEIFDGEIFKELRKKSKGK